MSDIFSVMSDTSHVARTLHSEIVLARDGSGDAETISVTHNGLVESKNGGPALPLVECVTDCFESLNPRDWTGMRESSDLSKHFADQGIKLSIRRKLRKRIRTMQGLDAGAEADEDAD
ncbi:hypothetical protein HDU67_003235 [Dinochytrium kinnereticum]|nr:hypothetical protein HDU67_003235 [Dinochytrium kinnereticum]